VTRLSALFGRKNKSVAVSEVSTKTPSPSQIHFLNQLAPFDMHNPAGSLPSMGNFPQWNVPNAPPPTPISSPLPVRPKSHSLIVVRKFSITDVRKPGETKEVTQLHYTEWPDSGVPDTTEQMSDLIRELDIRKGGLDDPIVVHCSAGIGRTGTFLAIHMALQQVVTSPEPCIDVFETVLNLRVQRTGMVQSKDQYKFVYVTLKDMLLRKYNQQTHIKNHRRDFFNLTHSHVDHIRTFLEKVPKNRPSRSASEPPACGMTWKRLIHEDELPIRLEEV